MKALRVPLPTEEWRHLKSMKRVRVEALARDEFTGETLVLYRELDEPGVLWSRPVAVFLEDGGQPRFAPAELHPVGK
jgi:hypothetical protein